MKKSTLKIIKKVCCMFILLLLILLGNYIIEAASTIKLNCNKLLLTEGKTYQMKIKGSKGKVSWTSSNKRVAIVSKKGRIRAKKAGKSIITAKIKGKKFRCKLTVRKVKIRLNKTRLTLVKGRSFLLKLKGTKKRAKWSSDKKAVASITNAGKVIGKKNGIAIITATLNGKKYKCIVMVLSNNQETNLNNNQDLAITPPTATKKEEQKDNNPYLDKTNYHSKEMNIEKINFVLPKDFMEVENKKETKYKGYFPVSRKEDKKSSGILLGVWENHFFESKELLEQNVLREAEIQKKKMEDSGYEVIAFNISNKAFDSGQAIVSEWTIETPLGSKKEMRVYDIVVGKYLVEVQIGNLKDNMELDIYQIGEDIMNSLRVLN